MTHSASFEILESRIAPAAFYVSSNAAMRVLNGAGQDVSDTADAGTVHATTAVVLHAGDTLFYDTINAHRPGRAEIPLVGVTAGTAIVFLTDDGTGHISGRLEFTEVTGMAVSDGFRGTVFEPITGSIVTAVEGNHLALELSKGSTVELALGHGSITGLTSAPRIRGDILAGGSISNITVLGVTGNLRTEPPSIYGTLAVGDTAGGHSVSFNGGNFSMTTSYSATPGENGASISNAYIRYGATSITAGNGADNAAGAGGAGGSLTNVRVPLGVVSMTVAAGHGGNSTFTVPVNDDDTAQDDAVQFNGGAGGSIGGTTVFLYPQAAGNDVLQAGSGGSSMTGAGGAGGSISGSTFRVSGTANGYTVTAGNGGSDSSGAGGGAGGALSHLSLSVGEVEVARPALASVLSVSFGQLVVSSGTGGGSASSPGSGGSIDHISLAAGGLDISGQGQLTAGASGIANGTAENHTTGGSISDSTLTLVGNFQSFQITGGAASQGEGNGAGDGGSILHVTVGNLRNTGKISVTAGSGHGGGNGGTINQLQVANVTALWQGLSVTAGDGGTGGSVLNSTIANSGLAMQSLTVDAGEQSVGLDLPALAAIAVTPTPNGGSVTGLQIVNRGTILAGHVVSGGGALGGDVKNLKIDDLFGIGTAASPFAIYAGSTKKGFSGSNGNNLGKLSQTTLNSPKGVITMGLGSQGGNGVGIGNGGHGGDIDGVTGTVGSLEIYASAGGSGSGTGNGGGGGSVSNVNVTAARGFVHAIVAGDGGDSGDSGGSSGLGGSISHVTVRGDIGNFTKAFSLAPGQTGNTTMGGLSAGRSGANRTATPTQEHQTIDLTNEIDNGNGAFTLTFGPDNETTGQINVSSDNLAGDIQTLLNGLQSIQDLGPGGTGSVTVTPLANHQFDVRFNADGDQSSLSGQDAADPTIEIGVTETIKGGNIIAATYTANGSINDVTAKGIAAILAGRPGAGTLTYLNAVASLTNIHATKIGADTGIAGNLHETVAGGKTFDFNNTGENDGIFEPNNAGKVTDGDIPVDGFVFVASGPVPVLPVAPLKLIQVQELK